MKKNNKLIKWLSSFGILFLLLLISFTSLIILVQLIPRSLIEKNVKSSALILEKEGVYPNYGFSEFHKLDTQTDALTFNMLYVANPSKPVESAMINNVLLNRTLTSQPEMLVDIVNGNTKDYYYYSYSRNWHGYQLFIRPLLMVMDFNGIKIVNGIFMLFLLVALCYLLWKKISAGYSICFMVVFSFMNLFIMPLCMQYCTCIDLAMIGMIVMLQYPKAISDIKKTCMLFFSLGALCNYFDWFTIPQLTYGLPFIVYYTLKKDRNPLKVMIITGLAWIAGYAIVLLSKWTVGTLLTGYNCFDLAFSSVEQRMSTNTEGINISLIIAVKTILVTLYHKGFGVIIIVINIIAFIINKNTWVDCFKSYYWLLIMACFVPIWFLIIRNHSFLHFGLFAWRALFLTFYSLLLYTYLVAYRIIIERKKNN